MPRYIGTMPLPGKRWWHLVLHTRGSWLHGDPRGFRSRDHRLHSSGDYKRPPPPDEHAGLRAYHRGRSAPPVVLSPSLRSRVGLTLRRKLQRQRHEALAISVGPTHAHLLAELPESYQAALTLSASWKQASSHAVRDELPGRVWAEGGKPIPIRNHAHQREVFDYIVDHARKEGAWVWTFRGSNGVG